MKFSVMVNEGPYTHQAADTAYHFTRAVLDAGHEIFRIFFIHFQSWLTVDLMGREGKEKL